MGDVDWVLTALRAVPVVLVVLAAEVWLRLNSSRRRRWAVRDLQAMVPPDLEVDAGGRKVVEDGVMRQAHVGLLGIAAFSALGGSVSWSTPEESAAIYGGGMLVALLLVLSVQGLGTLAAARRLERDRDGVRSAGLRPRDTATVAGAAEVGVVRTLLALHGALVVVVLCVAAVDRLTPSLALLVALNVLGVLAGAVQLAVVRVLTRRPHPAETTADTNVYRLQVALTLRAVQLLSRVLVAVLALTLALLVTRSLTSDPGIALGVAVAAVVSLLLVELASRARGPGPLRSPSLAPELARLGVPVRVGA